MACARQALAVVEVDRYCALEADIVDGQHNRRSS
jgi:hypothetical protein